MNIPNLTKLKVSDKEGNIHPEFFELLSQLLLQMQQNLSNEGFIIPQQTSDNITQLSTQQSKGALLYDKELDLLKVNINGVFKTVQVA